MTVEDLMVYHGGELRIGTEGAPITGSAEIVFACYGTCLDTGTTSAPGVDPEQFGLGLNAFGKVRMHGTAKTSHCRLNEEMTASETVATCDATPSGWQNGDTVAIPMTRQFSWVVDTRLRW
jgi:hypothetical protein